MTAGKMVPYRGRDSPLPAGASRDWVPKCYYTYQMAKSDVQELKKPKEAEEIECELMGRPRRLRDHSDTPVN